MDDIYYHKYLKYKMKYLELQKDNSDIVNSDGGMPAILALSKGIKAVSNIAKKAKKAASKAASNIAKKKSHEQGEEKLEISELSELKSCIQKCITK